MRHKYTTVGLVLARQSIAESAVLVTLLTPDLGLLYARAEGLRRPGAKLASALTTLSEVSVTVVRGKEGWRLSGAILLENWFLRLSPSARSRAGRIVGLTLRLIRGEAPDGAWYESLVSFIASLETRTEDAQDTAECYAALHLLSSLGLLAGDAPSHSPDIPLSSDERRALVARINNGIAASGL